MIKATELRIGNFVMFDKGTEYHNVQGVFNPAHAKERIIQLEGNFVSNREEQLFGIPLTVEILVKTGFELANDNYHGYLSKPFKGGRIRLCKSAEDKRNWYWNNGCWVTVIQYLHELQNLYFSLTGEELIYKN